MREEGENGATERPSERQTDAQTPAHVSPAPPGPIPPRTPARPPRGPEARAPGRARRADTHLPAAARERQRHPPASSCSRGRQPGKGREARAEGARALRPPGLVVLGFSMPGELHHAPLLRNYDFRRLRRRREQSGLTPFRLGAVRVFCLLLPRSSPPTDPGSRSLQTSASPQGGGGAADASLLVRREPGASGACAGEPSARDASWPAVSPLLPLGQANKPRALGALPAQLTAGYGQQDKLALESGRALSPAASARWAEAPGSLGNPRERCYRDGREEPQQLGIGPLPRRERKESPQETADVRGVFAPLPRQVPRGHAECPAPSRTHPTPHLPWAHLCDPEALLGKWKGPRDLGQGSLSATQKNRSGESVFSWRGSYVFNCFLHDWSTWAFYFCWNQF
ncbi:serine/arginine repetitive matrix protein 1-like [Mustela erminea]|uniref:serine/arginine repetitive matrix protein 1-like n=1 Tax=Mustela erminea TaxID=36723 RepID=UPI001386FF28|nr:serine/arginine repetitive matrix protein 1-like [Mustela erminea]